ncbi:hypothetical protein BJX96DRAFT_173366 [Aspergillus floccosus]
MASNNSHSLLGPRGRNAHEAVCSQSAGVCGSLEYPLYPLKFFNDHIDPALLDVFKDNGWNYESLGPGGVPYHPLTASAEGAQGMRGSHYIDLTQPGLNVGPTAEPHVTLRERDLNPTVGPQSRDEALQTLMCEWKDCNQKRAFRRDAELMRHIMTIHVRPNAYGCPVEGCSRVFNRKDNLKVHLEKKH